MSDLVKEKLLDELAELNRWFAEVKVALGLNPKADRGRVLASVERLCEEREEAKKEQQLVASYYSYKFWGDLVAAAKRAGEGLVAEVELPKEFLEVPTRWLLGEGKPNYDTAKKQLATTQRLVKKVFAFLEGEREAEGDEWVEENRKDVTEAFLESHGSEALNLRLWEYYKQVEPEPDPSEVWLQAAEQSRATLVTSEKLPPVAVTELLEYAEVEGVEATKKFVETLKTSTYTASHWFDYLLCAYLEKQQRPETELSHADRWKLASDVREAAKLGTLYNEVVGAWDETTTLTDLATAYNTYKAKVDDTTTWDEVKEALLEALGRQPVET